MLNKKYKGLLILFGVILFVISIYFHTIRDFQVYRFLRAIVSFSSLGLIIYLHGAKTSKLLTIYFILFATSSVLAIWYEFPRIPELMMGLNFLSFMSLVLYLKPKITKKKITIPYMTIFVGLILLNGYLLYLLIDMILVIEGNNTVYISMLISAIGMSVLSFVALLYNYTRSSTASLVFSAFVFVLVFSEVFRAIGYYDFAYGDWAVYIARLLFIISSSFLVHYTVINEGAKPASKKKFI